MLSLARHRCYDFQNIFGKKIGKKCRFLLFATLLFFYMNQIITLEKTLRKLAKITRNCDLHITSVPDVAFYFTPGAAQSVVMAPTFSNTAPKYLGRTYVHQDGNKKTIASKKTHLFLWLEHSGRLIHNKKSVNFYLRKLPCSCAVRGHCICKELPVILVNRVLDKN
jgi:hypothetical protein